MNPFSKGDWKKVAWKAIDNPEKAGPGWAIGGAIFVSSQAAGFTASGLRQPAGCSGSETEKRLSQVGLLPGKLCLCRSLELLGAG